MQKEAEIPELDFVLIRPYEKRDFGSLQRLFMTNWPEVEPHSRSEVDDSLKKGDKIFLAESGGETVGSLFYSHEEGEIYLSSILVKGELRRQGIAAAMIQHAQDEALQEGYCQVSIVAATRDLIKYYESLGFGLIKGTMDLVKNMSPVTSNP